MKSIKIFAALLILITGIVLFANYNDSLSVAVSIAPEVKIAKYNAGQEFYTSWSSVDSTVSAYETDKFDISTIDGQLQGSALNISYSLTSTGGTADSVLLSLIGVDANGIEQVLGTKILIGSTTGGATFTTLSTTLTLANVKYKITNNQGTGAAATNRAGMILYISGYFPKVDDIPETGTVKWGSK